MVDLAKIEGDEVVIRIPIDVLKSAALHSGLRVGDTLRIRAVSDLGRGQESKRIQVPA